MNRQISSLWEVCDKLCNRFYDNPDKKITKKIIFNYVKCKIISQNTHNKLRKYELLFIRFCYLDNYLRTYISFPKTQQYFPNIIHCKGVSFKNDYDSLARKCLIIVRKLIRTAKTNKPVLKSDLKSQYVDYAILLSNIGRLIPSIHIYNSKLPQVIIREPSAQGNFSSTLAAYADMTNSSYIRYIALCYLHNVINKKKKYDVQIKYLRRNVNILQRSPVKKRPNNYSGFCEIIKRLMNLKLCLYDKWISKHDLFLNPLNDVNCSIRYNVNNHCLHHIKSFNIINAFNFIKQKYISARYSLYLGLAKHGKDHFTDKVVNITFTKGIIDNYYIEILKDAFERLYSIFDNIAFVINNYFNLGIKGYRISFHDLYWTTSRNGRIKRGNGIKKLFKIYPNKLQNSGSGYALRGLYWMSQDFYDDNIKDGLDYELHISNQIRNSIEHRGLYILNDDIKGKYYHHINNDNTYSISWTEYKNNIMHLAFSAREAIILLAVSLNSIIRIPIALKYFPDGHNKKLYYYGLKN